MKKPSTSRSSFTKAFPLIVSVTGFLGLLASFMLTVDKFKVLKDPSFVPNCNLNPIFSCSSVMTQPQAEVWGIPNTLFGVIAFSVVITVGIAMFFGARYHKRFWQLFQLGALAGLAGVVYLFFQGVYRIGAVCPWCSLTWLSVIALNVYLLVWNLRSGFITFPKKLAPVSTFLQRNHLGILLSIYLVIVCLILNHFWYYFGS